MGDVGALAIAPRALDPFTGLQGAPHPYMNGIWGQPVTLGRIATDPINNDVSTWDTLQQMVRVARVSANSPRVHWVANQCLKHRVEDTIRCIYWWVKRHVTFCSDESLLATQFGILPDNELLIAPDTLLQMPSPMGDCDDFSLLIASLLKCLLIPVRFVAVAVDGGEPDRWSHVYCLALVGGEWMALDASHGGYPGWEYSGPVYKRIEVNV